MAWTPASEREFAAVRRAVRHRDRLREQLAAARAELDRHGEACERLAANLEKEGEDVRKLEGLTFTSLVAGLFGDRDRRLDQEKQELHRARLRYDEQRTALATAREEVAAIEAELRACPPDLDARQRDLREAKAAFLVATAGAAGRALAEHSDRIAEAGAALDELREATVAGESALAAVREVERELAAASNWGIADLAGGGLLTTWAKHGRLDRAKSAAALANRRLQRFRNELADVRSHRDVGIAITGFDRFADYFLDGLLFDWIVQSKIDRARKDVGARAEAIRSALRELRRRMRETETAHAELEARRLELLDGDDAAP